MCLITGRPFSQLKKVSGSFVGKKGLKIKAWQFRATYLFDFKGLNRIPGLFHRAVFSILCPFEVRLSVAISQTAMGGGEESSASI